MDRRPLPFPVRDVSDLKRAIRYAESHRDVRNYVSVRARALGHVDILPATWKTMPTQVRTTSNLDEQFEELAATHGLSTARLKTVYFRGVEEFFTSELNFGSASMYGLARVQRFVQGDETLDQDLTAVDPEVLPDDGMEFTIDSALVISDLVYASGENIAAQFAPGQVTGMSMNDDTLYVEGTIGTAEWNYTLDFATGEHSFKVQ